MNFLKEVLDEEPNEESKEVPIEKPKEEPKEESKKGLNEGHEMSIKPITEYERYAFLDSNYANTFKRSRKFDKNSMLSLYWDKGECAVATQAVNDSQTSGQLASYSNCLFLTAALLLTVGSA